MSSTFTGFALSGADAANYTVVQPTGLSANVTPASLAVTGVTASNRVYDATTVEALGGTAAVAALGSDVVTVSGTGAGAFATNTVGTAKAVTVTGYSLSGTDAANYTVVQPTGLSADITAIVASTLPPPYSRPQVNQQVTGMVTPGMGGPNGAGAPFPTGFISPSGTTGAMAEQTSSPGAANGTPTRPDAAAPTAPAVTDATSPTSQETVKPETPAERVIRIERERKR